MGPDPLPQNNQNAIYIDEVGRGSLFGPVTVGGVCLGLSEYDQILKQTPSLANLRDSKELKESAREFFAHQLNLSLNFSVVHIPVWYINKFGIQLAIEAGVFRVIRNLHTKKTSIAIMDGNYRFKFDRFKKKRQLLPNFSSVVSGDRLFWGIAAASNLAKVSRDRLISKSAYRFPKYNLDKNKGYPTRFHRSAIQTFGETRFHRKKFLRNIKNAGQVF